MKKQILLDNLEQLETKEYTKMTPMLVPENFTELIELCKDLKGVAIIHDEACIYFRHLFFWKEGIIEDEKQNLLSEATPERQYRIIKSLIGEE